MVSIKEDLLSDKEKVELEESGTLTTLIERFVEVAFAGGKQLNFNTLGPEMTKPRVRQDINYHKGVGTPIRFFADTGELKFVKRPRVEACF